MKKSMFLIGLFVVVVGLGIGIFIFLASDSVGLGTYDLTVDLHNANGLILDTDVRISGVKVGRINKITLLNNKAHLTLEIKKDIKIYKEDTLERVPQGILGSSFLQIFPSTQANKTLLTHGDAIENINDLTFIEKVTSSASKVIDDVEFSTDQIKSYLEDSLFFDQLDRIVDFFETTIANLAIITTDLAQSSHNSSQDITEILSSIQNIARTLEVFLVGNASDDESNLAQNTTNSSLSESLIAIQRTLKNLEDITSKVSQGQGTLGKLLNDDTLYDQASAAVTDISKITSRAVGLYTEIDYLYTGLISENLDYTSRNSITLRIDPAQTPRYYQLGITMGGPESFPGTPDYTVDNYLKYNLLIAQRLGKIVTIKGGLLENTGGLGIDITPISQIQISTEAFDFGGGNAGINMRAGVFVYPFFDPKNITNPLKWLYLTGGADDIFNSYQRSYYWGAGIRIRDEFIHDSIRILPIASGVNAIAR